MSRCCSKQLDNWLDVRVEVSVTRVVRDEVFISNMDRCLFYSLCYLQYVKRHSFPVADITQLCAFSLPELDGTARREDGVVSCALGGFTL